MKEALYLSISSVAESKKCGQCVLLLGEFGYTDPLTPAQH